MNKIIYLIVFSVLLLSCKISRDGELKLSGNTVIARHEWTNDQLTGLQINDNNNVSNQVKYNIEVIKGATFSLEMTCDEVLLPYILLSENINDLTIELYYPMDHYLYLQESSEIDITLILPDLTHLYIYNEANIDISTFTELKSIHIDAQNSEVTMANIIEVTEWAYLYTKLNGLNSLTANLIDIKEQDDVIDKNLTELNGTEVSLSGSFNIDTITGDSVSLSGDISVDKLSTTDLILTPDEELSITELTSDHITVNYSSQALVSLPEGTFIDKTNIEISSQYEDVEFESIITSSLNITLSDESSLFINQLNTETITLINSESSINLPSNLDCHSIYIETDNGIINMGGNTKFLSIKMDDNYSSENLLLYLPFLNTVDCVLDLGTYNELRLGLIDNLLYTLDNNTKLDYDGGLISESGTLGSYNITINGEDVK